MLKRDVRIVKDIRSVINAAAQQVVVKTGKKEDSVNLLGKDDLIKYFELKKHNSPVSSNIGVIGDMKYFKRKVRSILKTLKHYDFMYANKELTRYTIINNGIETTYIKVESLEDLKDTYFRRYIC